MQAWITIEQRGGCALVAWLVGAAVRATLGLVTEPQFGNRRWIVTSFVGGRVHVGEARTPYPSARFSFRSKGWLNQRQLCVRWVASHWRVPPPCPPSPRLAAARWEAIISCMPMQLYCFGLLARQYPQVVLDVYSDILVSSLHDAFMTDDLCALHGDPIQQVSSCNVDWLC